MSEIKISNTIVNDDENQVIVYADQVLDRNKDISKFPNKENRQSFINSLVKKLSNKVSELEIYKGGVTLTLDEYDALEEKEPILYFITDGTTLFYIFFGTTLIGKRGSDGGTISAFPYTFPITF